MFGRRQVLTVYFVAEYWPWGLVVYKMKHFCEQLGLSRERTSFSVIGDQVDLLDCPFRVASKIRSDA